MFLLSLQTGLIDMEMPHRLGAMSVILFIVAASLFQVKHKICTSVLHRLLTTSNINGAHSTECRLPFFSYIITA